MIWCPGCNGSMPQGRRLCRDCSIAHAKDMHPLDDPNVGGVRMLPRRKDRFPILLFLTLAFLFVLVVWAMWEMRR